MEEITQNDIRRLLKTFGVKSDQAITAHLEQNPAVPALRLRLILEDITDYGSTPPASPLRFEVEGEVRRS